VSAGLRAFLRTVADHPDSAQTLLVQIIGAGPRAAERRDAIIESFAENLYLDNERWAPRHGAPRFATREDAYAVIGAIVELVARELRLGRADRLAELQPVLERVIHGVLSRGR
jgi:hypothetical protein